MFCWQKGIQAESKQNKKEGIQKENLAKVKTLFCGFYYLNPQLISKWHTHKKRTNGILFGLADVFEDHAEDMLAGTSRK